MADNKPKKKHYNNQNNMTLEEKIRALLLKGVTMSSLVSHVREDLDTRFSASREGFKAEAERIPQAMENLVSEYGVLKKALSDQDYSDSLAFDMLSKGVNPLLNAVQKMLVRQAEIVSFRELEEGLNNAQGVIDFVKLFEPVEPAGSFWDRNVINSKNKYFMKIINLAMNLAQGDLKKQREESFSVEYKDKDKEGEVEKSPQEESKS